MEARFTSAITSERMPKGFCRGDFCLYAELSIIGAKMSQNFILVVAKRFLHFFISYLHHVYFLICINILNLRLRKHIKILRFWKCCTRAFLCLTIRFLSSHFCTQVVIFIVSLNKQIILEDPISLFTSTVYDIMLTLTSFLSHRQLALICFIPFIVSIIKWLFRRKDFVSKKIVNGCRDRRGGCSHLPSFCDATSNFRTKNSTPHFAQFFTVEGRRKSFFLSLIENSARVDVLTSVDEDFCIKASQVSCDNFQELASKKIWKVCRIKFDIYTILDPALIHLDGNRCEREKGEMPLIST